MIQEQVQVKVKAGLETLRKGVDIQPSIPVYTERKELERTSEMAHEKGMNIPKAPGVNTPWQNWQ